MGLRITTWNVNGIRNPFGYQPWRDDRSFGAMFDILEADIVIMQELKIQRKDLKDDMVLVPGWDCYFSLPKHKKGYSGVGIYTRQSTCAPIRAEEGLLGVLCPPDSSTPYRNLESDCCIGGYPTYSQIADFGVDPVALDAEGRCVVLEFPAFVLFGVYCPANSNGLRDDFRFAFWSALDARIRNLDKMGKRVILTGDLNVLRNEMDSAGAEEDRKKMGMSREEYVSTPIRRIFNQLIEGGDVVGERDEGREKPVLWDICRGFHSERKGMYTHWDQKLNARPGNYGSRIDFVLCSLAMRHWFCESNIQEGLMGSDHCPVYAVCKDMVAVNDEQVSIRNLVNPPEFFQSGTRIRDPTDRDLPSLSARLLPEFDRRRNIRDMFKSQASTISRETTARSTASQPKHLAADTSADISQADGLETLPNSSRQTVVTSLAPSLRISSPNRKRKPPIQSHSFAAKRSKSTTPNMILGSGSSSQQTLKSFFQPKTTAKLAHELDSAATPTGLTCPSSSELSPLKQSPIIMPSLQEFTTSNTSPDQCAAPTPTTALTPDETESQNNTASSLASPTVFDPIVSKEGWTRLFTKPQAPLCEGHEEPCISLDTKKKGFNCGRSFWICPRPVGPTGTKERNTEWRCRTFIWASDWTGSGESAPAENSRVLKPA